jgi:hypothetical protein
MIQRYFAICILSMTAVLACGDDGFTITSSADIALEPELILGDDGAEYANVLFDQPSSVGRFKENVLKIKNSGIEDLVITSIAISGHEDCDRVKKGVAPKQPLGSAPDGTNLDETCYFAIEQAPGFATATSPLTVPPGGEIQVVLSFKAINLNPVEPQSLVIASNAVGRQNVTARLSVRAGSAQLSISKDAVSFPAGSGESTESLLFRNSGTSKLVISSWRVVPLTELATDASGSPVSEFRVLDSELPEPFEIGPNNSVEVRIRYTPIDEGRDEAQLVVTSNSALSATNSVFLTSGSLSSELVAQPNPVIFAEAAPNQPSTKLISLRNAGLKLLSIQGITITPENQGFKLLDDTGREVDITDPMNPRPIIDIPGGSARNLSVVYEPTGGEDVDGTMVIRTTADNVQATGGSFIVPLRLSGADVADLEIDKLTVNFSTVAAGESSTSDVTLTNPGGQPLEISRIGMSTDMDEGLIPSDMEFSVTAGGGAITLAAGASHTVTVGFTRGAEDRNRRVGALVIESNASTGRDVVYITSNPPL